MFTKASITANLLIFVMRRLWSTPTSVALWSGPHTWPQTTSATLKEPDGGWVSEDLKERNATDRWGILCVCVAICCSMSHSVCDTLCMRHCTSLCTCVTLGHSAHLSVVVTSSVNMCHSLHVTLFVTLCMRHCHMCVSEKCHLFLNTFTVVSSDSYTDFIQLSCSFT